MAFYTGIGSRKTPPDILKLMTQIAVELELRGYCLRSGGANGADTAFELGCNLKEIYLPWKNFNKSTSSLVYGNNPVSNYIAKDLHPAWNNLKQGAKKLMSRNVNQVIGTDFHSLSEFLICWTPDGCESHSTRSTTTGGTGLAISLGSNLGIPVYNLRNEETLSLIKKELNIK